MRGQPVKERFWSKVKQPEGCWEWTASLINGRHGYFYGGKNQCAHTFSWELHYGEIPEGMHVLHKCDNPKCVRPDHLFLGTHKDNMEDRAKKGRHACGNGKKIDRELVRMGLKQGKTIAKIAKELGACTTTIQRIKRKLAG